MKVNKALILGIDALEYDLVEQWNLKNLKQEEYGKIELPIKEKSYIYTEPATLVIWPCFITGHPPKDNGIISIKTYKQPIKWFVDNVYSKFKVGAYFSSREKIEGFNFRRWVLDTASKTLSKLNMARMPNRKDLKTSTIFDIDNVRSVHLHVPVYDEDAFPSYRGKEVKAIEDKAYRPIHEMLCLQEFKQRTQEVFHWLERKYEWDLLMQYFFVLDSIQHVFYNNPKKIAKFYIMFDEFVGKIRQKIDDDTLLLIVSDHGQKKGIHTDYGFYSVNKPLGLKNPKLIDFRWIIEDLLKERKNGGK